MNRLLNTGFKDLFIIEQNKNSDKRGFFSEIFVERLLNEKLSYDFKVCQANLVESKLGVLRGLHFQKGAKAQSKLITVIKGEILDVAVDLRKDSKTYGKYYSIKLSNLNKKSIFIPKGFAHGYLALKDKVIISYLVDNYYDRGSEIGIPYNDKLLNIDWEAHCKSIIISKKDRNYFDFNWK